MVEGEGEGEGEGDGEGVGALPMFPVNVPAVLAAWFWAALLVPAALFSATVGEPSFLGIFTYLLFFIYSIKFITMNVC